MLANCDSINFPEEPHIKAQRRSSISQILATVTPDTTPSNRYPDMELPSPDGDYYSYPLPEPKEMNRYEGNDPLPSLFIKDPIFIYPNLTLDFRTNIDEHPMTRYNMFQSANVMFPLRSQMRMPGMYSYPRKPSFNEHASLVSSPMQFQHHHTSPNHVLCSPTPSMDTCRTVTPPNNMFDVSEFQGFQHTASTMHSIPYYDGNMNGIPANFEFKPRAKTQGIPANFELNPRKIQEIPQSFECEPRPKSQEIPQNYAFPATQKPTTKTQSLCNEEPPSPEEQEQLKLLAMLEQPTRNFQYGQGEVDQEITNLSRFQCACGKLFQKLCGLKSHIKVHKLQKEKLKLNQGGKLEWLTSKGEPIRISPCELRRSYICDHCRKSFLRRQDLRRHVMTAHTMTNRPLICPLCNATFSRSDALYRHVTTKRCRF